MREDGTAPSHIDPGTALEDMFLDKRFVDIGRQVITEATPPSKSPADIFWVAVFSPEN